MLLKIQYVDRDSTSLLNFRAKNLMHFIYIFGGGGVKFLIPILCNRVGNLSVIVLRTCLPVQKY